MLRFLPLQTFGFVVPSVWHTPFHLLPMVGSFSVFGTQLYLSVDPSSCARCLLLQMAFCLVVESRGFLFGMAHGLLVVVASLVVEHRL